MLKKLFVEQFVIIEKLDLDFQNRLTIFTGETGAGKSIILGAMGLILGEPSKPQSIRQGSHKSEFEAVFAPKPDHAVWSHLKEKGYVNDGDTEFIINRTMKLEGEDDVLINKKPITVKILNEIGNYLIEIHGQFANQNLLGPENQLKLLDLSGNFPEEVFTNVSNALDGVHKYAKELEEEKTFLARHKGLAGKKVQDIYKRFKSVDMKEGYIAQIKEEYSTLRTAKETMEAFQSMLGRFIATNGIVGSLGAAKKTLANQKNLDAKKMEKLSQYLSEALTNASASVEEMNRLVPEYEIDLAPLELPQKKLTTLKALAQEAKLEFDDLEAYYKETYTKYHRIKNGRERLAEINDLLIKSKNEYRQHAEVLTEKRTAAGIELSKLITAEFIPLMLNKAQFEVEVEEKPDMEWTHLGFNEVTFKARMNPGMPFSPIAKTASGGELARMILALKVVLQRVQTTPTLVFDEVDTGIGGAAAAAVGERIAHLADTSQVLVITHSPQVASRGDQHLHISKRTDGETTISSVRELTMEERIDEISRMLAGDTITDQSQAAAQSLLDEAAKAAQQRRQHLPAD